jgi:hypothetical protein
MLVWEGGGRREAPVRPGRPPVCRRVRRRRGPPPLTAAPAPFGTLHRLRQMETKMKRSAARDRVVLGDGFRGSRLGPQEGEVVRCIFFGAWRARAAETEEGGAGETRARVGRPSLPAGRGSGEASDVSTREWNEALPGALRSLRFQGV